MALSPSMSTGGLPKPHLTGGAARMSGLLKASMPKIGSGMKGGSSALKGVSMPKVGTKTTSAKMPKMPSTKAAKTTLKASSVSSTLKSLLGKSSKLGRVPATSMSSAVGAPAEMPAPSFFGSANPSKGAPGLGM